MKEIGKSKTKKEKKNFNRWRKVLQTKNRFTNYEEIVEFKFVYINLKEEESKGKKGRKEKK
jgi:transcriptional regulator NrdR family protein